MAFFLQRFFNLERFPNTNLLINISKKLRIRDIADELSLVEVIRVTFTF
jgi:hypothetical protein